MSEPMKQILNKVTVTGAGDGIDPQLMVDIQQRYPFVEFGILLSKKYTVGDGAIRFPSRAWLKRLVKTNSARPLHLSGHLCGQWVRELLAGNLVDLDDVVHGLNDAFGRFQINTHAEPHDFDTEAIERILSNNPNQSFIFQIDGKAGSKLAHEFAHQGWDNAHGLFDLSHGAGLLPPQWPKPISGLHCGYAGGLSPENVARQLATIETLTDYTWIDAETSLFHAGRFDLARVVAFLEASKEWAISGKAKEVGVE